VNYMEGKGKKHMRGSEAMEMRDDELQHHLKRMFVDSFLANASMI